MGKEPLETKTRHRERTRGDGPLSCALEEDEGVIGGMPDRNAVETPICIERARGGR